MILEEWNFRGNLHGRIKQEIEHATEMICSGSCSHEEYKFLAGRISAFNDALDISKQIVAAQEGRDNAEA